MVAMTDSLEQIAGDILNCRGCQLCEHRANAVPGMGAPKAVVMFVGEGPGESEDAQGLPFVGKSGQLFNLYLSYVGLSRSDDVFVTNVVKCHPPKNRDPLPQEIESCKGFLRRQVRVLRPKIIVCLGRIASVSLISPDFKITTRHGEVYDKNGTLMMGMFHPAALLRSPSRKGDALDDFLKLRELVDTVK